MLSISSLLVTLFKSFGDGSGDQISWMDLLLIELLSDADFSASIGKVKLTADSCQLFTSSLISLPGLRG